MYVLGCHQILECHLVIVPDTQALLQSPGQGYTQQALKSSTSLNPLSNTNPFYALLTVTPHTMTPASHTHTDMDGIFCH